MCYEEEVSHEDLMESVVLPLFDQGSEVFVVEKQSLEFLKHWSLIAGVENLVCERNVSI